MILRQAPGTRRPPLAATPEPLRSERPSQLQHGAVPTRILLALGVVVLLAHAVVLRHVPLGLDAVAPLQTRVFTTRSLQIEAVAAPRQTNRPVSMTPRAQPKPAPARPGKDGVLSAVAPTQPVPVQPPAPVAKPPDQPPPAPLPAEVAASPIRQPEPALAEPEAQAASAPIPAADPVAVAATPAASEPIALGRSTPAPPYTIPGSIRLRFDATGKRGRLDYRAMGTLIWLHDGTDYDARMEMGDWIIGTRVLSSTGKVTGDGLAPRRFSDKFRSERAAHFDRQLNRIVFSANTPTAPLLPGAQDQISIFVQLAALVAGDPLNFPIGRAVSIQTVGPRDAEPWLFTVEKEEMLDLPGGQVPALKLVRKPARDFSQTVELWLAPALSYLPARIRISFANGDHIDQQWRSSSPP